MGLSPMKLGLQIAQARRRKALTQRELAVLCGCTIPYLSDIERGRAYPSAARILLGLAAVLGISADELLQRIQSERGRAKPKAGNAA